MRIRATAVALLLAIATPAIAQTDGQVGVVTDMWAGTDAKAGQDLEIFDSADPASPLRIIPMGGRGAVQNLRDILYLRGVDAGFVPSDVLTYARENKLLTPTELSRIQYIAKLYDEEVHILAGPAIATIEDLDGKRVNADVPGSGSAMTADIVFRALDIHPDVRHERQAEGLMALRRGEIDAILQVGGAPVPILAGVPPGSLHMVPIPIRTELAETYMPATVTHEQYPYLVSGEPIQTLAIGDVLAVFGWAKGSQRGQNVARFTDALFDRIAELQKPPRHPKWQDVNLAATVPGWTRFPEADVKLRAKFEADRLAEVATDGHPRAITPELKAALYREFVAWKARGGGKVPE